MISLNLVIKSELDFEHYFETLCNLINLQNSEEEEKAVIVENTDPWHIEQSEKQRLFELSSNVLQIFRTMVQRRMNVPQLVYLQPQSQGSQYGRSSTRLSARQSTSSLARQSTHLNNAQNAGPVMVDASGNVLSPSKQAEQLAHLQHGTYLLKCKSFFQLLIKIMYEREIQAVPFKTDIIPMLQDMICIPDFVMKMFIDQGLILFLLNLIFDTKYSSVITKEMRGTLTDQVLKIDRVMQGVDRGNLLGFADRQSYGVVKAFIPPNFFAEINEQLWRWRDYHKAELVQLQMRFLDHFDADYYENALVKWDKNLREQSLSRV